MPTRKPDPWTPWVLTQRRQVGDRIRSLRQAQKLSQEDLALRAGVDRSTVYRAELATHGISIDAAQRLARVLGVDVTSLFAAEWIAPPGGGAGGGEAVWDAPPERHP